MITVKNLTKIYRTPVKTQNLLKDIFFRQYKENKALDKISFEIEEGELVGFIGPNGAGKTTTLKILSGVLHPTNGYVNVLGYTPFDKKYSFLRQIAFVMGQKNQLIWELPASDSFQLTKEIYEIDEVIFKKTIDELITLLDCHSFLNKPVKTLSLGQRMRLELINSLLYQPKILFLDEPTIGLDIFAQTAIINFIATYQRRYQATIILTSHYMQDIRRLAKRVIIINEGKIVFDGHLTNLIHRYSQQKTIHIILAAPLPRNFSPPNNFQYQYNFPELKITIPKEKIASSLSAILKQIEFYDVTVEDESIEEVIKKIFKKTTL